MRTEDDIRAACEYLEQDPPNLEDLLAMLTRPDPRRRPQLATCLSVAASILAVAAIAIAIAGWARPGSHHRPAAPLATPPTGPAPTPRFSGPARGDVALSYVTFTVAVPPTYRVIGYDSGRVFQRVSLVRPSSADAGPATITLYRPGAYDGATTGPPVSVGGHPGVIVVDAHPASVGYRATDPTRDERAVVWQYAPGAWAMAAGGSGATSAAVDQANVSLARAIRLGSTELRVPFLLDYLPGGLALESIGMRHNPARATDQDGTLSFKDARPAGSPLTDAPWGSAMDLTVWTHHVSFGAGFGCPSNPRQFAVDRYTGCFLSDHGVTSGLLIDVRGHTVRIVIDAAHYGRYSDADLVRILAGLDFAMNVDDPATWFEAADALP